MFTLANPSSLTISGVGDATLLQPADIGNVFIVNAGRAITFANFSVDLLRVPFTFGRVTQNTPQGALLQFDATGLYSVDLARFPWLGRAQSVLGYDIQKGRPAAPPNVTDIYALGSPIPLTYVSAAGLGEATLPGFRPALPSEDGGGALCVCDGNYISAQCGGDAFALGRALIDRLESTATTY